MPILAPKFALICRYIAGYLAPIALFRLQPKLFRKIRIPVFAPKPPYSFPLKEKFHPLKEKSHSLKDDFAHDGVGGKPILLWDSIIAYAGWFLDADGSEMAEAKLGGEVCGNLLGVAATPSVANQL